METYPELVQQAPRMKEESRYRIANGEKFEFDIPILQKVRSLDPKLVQHIATAPARALPIYG